MNTHILIVIFLLGLCNVGYSESGGLEEVVENLEKFKNFFVHGDKPNREEFIKQVLDTFPANYNVLVIRTKYSQRVIPAVDSEKFTTRTLKMDCRCFIACIRCEFTIFAMPQSNLKEPSNTWSVFNSGKDKPNVWGYKGRYEKNGNFIKFW